MAIGHGIERTQRVVGVLGAPRSRCTAAVDLLHALPGADLGHPRYRLTVAVDLVDPRSGDVLHSRTLVHEGETTAARAMELPPDAAPAAGPLWQMTVGGNPGDGRMPLQGRFESNRGAWQSVEGFTGISYGEGGGARWKAGVTFSGGVATGRPVTIPTAAERADTMSKRYQSWKPRVSSGSVTVRGLQGTYAVAESANAFSTGWGTAYSWFYAATVASLSVSASVSANADAPVNDAAAKRKFEQLKAEATAAMAALEVKLE